MRNLISIKPYKLVNNPEKKKNNTDLEKLLEERKLR